MPHAGNRRFSAGELIGWNGSPICLPLILLPACKREREAAIQRCRTGVSEGPVTIEFTKIDEAIVRRAADVLAVAKGKGLTLVTAESCTGGLLAAVLSEAPGAGKQLQGG